MKRKFFLSLLVFILAFCFIGCGDNDDPPSGGTGGGGSGGGGGGGDTRYTVRFNLDGGNINGNTASVEIQVTSGGTIDNLPNPQKANYSFGGWFTGTNGSGNQFTTTTAVTSNITVYANWTSFNGKTLIINGFPGPMNDGNNDYFIGVAPPGTPLDKTHQLEIYSANDTDWGIPSKVITVSNGIMTIQLYTIIDSKIVEGEKVETWVPWTGSGTYDVWLTTTPPSSERPPGNWYKASNVSFTSSTTTIEASSFQFIAEY